DTPITLGQSFREAARHLGLIKSNQDMEDNAVILKVKNWLFETSEFPLASPCSYWLNHISLMAFFLDPDDRWLLVFDNADNLDTLKYAWPKNSTGSVLLTTRDFNGAFNPALDGSHVRPFDDKTGSSALLNILGLDPQSSSNFENAEAITSTLGGLPLALNQIGGFITQRKIPLQDFLPLYERNAMK